ncbi:MAG: hypothetical protein E3J25_02785 [Anaerolineales bacterium]|nr:MAG: hypothetical protein E3J25_02785 [Anaerolineales bacterium]
MLKRIAELVPTRASASRIRDQLENEALKEQAQFSVTEIPSLRTVQNIVADLRPPKASDPWALAAADTDEAALVMPVWREVVEYTQWEVSHLTKAEAEWIVKIRRVAPELYPEGLSFSHIYLLAREYVLLTDREKPTTGPDAYLAYAPWESLLAALRYGEALRKKRIPARLIPDLETEEAMRTKEEANGRETSEQ